MKGFMMQQTDDETVTNKHNKKSTRITHVTAQLKGTVQVIGKTGITKPWRMALLLCSAAMLPLAHTVSQRKTRRRKSLL
jgi:hypothetical protein